MYVVKVVCWFAGAVSVAFERRDVRRLNSENEMAKERKIHFAETTTNNTSQLNVCVFLNWKFTAPSYTGMCVSSTKFTWEHLKSDMSPCILNQYDNNTLIYYDKYKKFVYNLLYPHRIVVMMCIFWEEREKRVVEKTIHYGCSLHSFSSH